MRFRFKQWMQAVVAGLALVAGVGCAGVAGKQGKATDAVTGSRNDVGLSQGMSPEEVRAVLGEPARMQPVRVGNGMAEQWIYERGQSTEVHQVVAGTREVPYFDPFLNQIRMIPEPAYAEEATTVIEELSLLWQSGVLVEWRTEYRRDKRSYAR